MTAWVNQKDFRKLPILDEMTCNTILLWKRRKAIKPLVRRESDGSYSVFVDMDEKIEEVRNG